MKNMSGPERGAWSRRPSFTPRQMLTAEQLNAGLADELMRQQLLNRAVHGYGVVLGFALSVDDDGALDLRRGCLKLSGGLALDRHGRMLLWGGGRLGPGDLVGSPPPGPGWYTLCAHYARCAPQDVDCRPGDEAYWVQEGVVFSLRQGRPGVDRDCPDHPPGRCLSHDEYLGVRSGSLPGAPESPDVGWLLREPGRLRRTGDDDWEYDPDPAVCVPLACLHICDLAANDDPDPYPGKEDGKDALPDNGGTDPHQSSKGDDKDPHQHSEPDDKDPHPYPVEERAGDSLQGPATPDRWHHGAHPEPQPDPCDPRYGFCPGTKPDTVAVRPFVYRNPLLYELTRCCDADLPRVRSVSWQDWLDESWPATVPWRAFEEQMTSSGLEVRFTGPLDPRTLHEASIFITVFYQQDDASWLSYRVPLAEVATLGKNGDDGGDEAWGARLVLDDEWLGAEVTGRRSNLVAGARVEITVRGQLLRDRCGRMLDARPPGLECGARCQSRPGDDLVTAFQVERRAQRPQKGGYSEDAADTGDAT